MTAAAATHDNGFPPKVLAWEPPVQSMIFVLEMVAPIGSPEAKAFELQMMSGSTFQCSMANHLPVLPMPDCTSSSISKRPYLSASFLSLGKYSGGGTT